MKLQVHNGKNDLQRYFELNTIDCVGDVKTRVISLTERAFGGQTVIDESSIPFITKEELQVKLEDRGTHQMKDLKSPLHVYEVLSSELKRRKFSSNIK